MAETTSNQLMQDVRAVHDTASLQVRHYVVAGQPRWIVAEVIPGDRSGSATIPGAYIDASGSFVQPDKADTVLVEEGTWKPVFIGGGNLPAAAESYSWNKPLKENRTPGPDDFYSPFSSGGTIIFRPEPTSSGRDWFADVRMVFPHWGRQVELALEFIHSYPELAQPQLVTDKNPLVAVLTFRELISARRLPAELARNVLIGAQGYEAATFVYLMIPAGFEQEVLYAVQSAEDTSKLRLCALGVYAAGLFTRDTHTTVRIQSVLNSIQQRLTQMSRRPDEYLSLIFEQTGIRG